MADEVPWWKKARDLSRERRAGETLRRACARPGDSFLIVTEGSVTEPVYFNLLRESLQLSPVTVKVMPGNTSDASRVIQSAADEVKKLALRATEKKIPMTELEEYDQVWAVIDTDVDVRNENWNDVVRKARDLNVKLAHSTPCFEFWLLLHLTMTTRADLVNGAAAKEAFREELGNDYSTNRKITKQALARLIVNWPVAVKNAQQVRKHHENARTRFPANPSTDVDLLVCAMNDSLAFHLRRTL